MMPVSLYCGTIMSTIVYTARRIVTMNPNNPFPTHVAVRDGRILGAGTLESLKGWGKFDLDERALPIGTAMLVETAKRFLE